MPKRLAHRIKTKLEHVLPEQRLFLKTDDTTRFIRLRPVTRAFIMLFIGLLLLWTAISTSILLMQHLTAGTDQDQAAQQQILYEERLTALSNDRDRRAEEAAGAQKRFNLALTEVSRMQSRLLASEEQRKELETGIDVIQNTLRRTIKERDEARAALSAQMAQHAPDAPISPEDRLKETAATMQVLSRTLAGTAQERDNLVAIANQALEDTATISREKEVIEQRNEVIFGKLEEALTVSMSPLDKMFRQAGLSPDNLLKQVRSGYSGKGGPLTPIVSHPNRSLGPDEKRANAILEGLDNMNSYRLAAVKTPFANPIPSGNYRFTSGFGYRSDPRGWGTRMHKGLDFAGSQGTPIKATADGTVIKAGWHSGYGQMVEIRHEFGITTLYGHLSRINVTAGQKLSRGDLIGGMGNTGRSTGTHLHYEVHVDGRPVNPMNFIKAANDVF